MSHNIPKGFSDVQFVLLGLVIDGEKTGTELRQILRDEYNWDTSTSSFYTYFERLGKEKLCIVKSTKAGKKFRASAKGKKLFKEKLKFMQECVKKWS